MSAPEAPFGPRHSPNTPEGQIESIGMFARGLGDRRIKIIAVVFMAFIGLVALIGAL
jgi:hypothetical protein